MKKLLQALWKTARAELDKFRRTWLKQVVQVFLMKALGVLGKVCGLALAAAVIAVITAYLPLPAQSKLIAILRELHVPSVLLPSDPQAIAHSIATNKQGFGYATLIFVRARELPDLTVHYDVRAMPEILVCHPWSHSARTRYDVLIAFLEQHPKCFVVTQRQGGGIEIEPNMTEGDQIRKQDGKVVAFACECRRTLSQVRAGFFQDRGLEDKK